MSKKQHLLGIELLEKLGVSYLRLEPDSNGKFRYVGWTTPTRRVHSFRLNSKLTIEPDGSSLAIADCNAYRSLALASARSFSCQTVVGSSLQTDLLSARLGPDRKRISCDNLKGDSWTVGNNCMAGKIQPPRFRRHEFSSPAIKQSFVLLPSATDAIGM